MEMLGIGLLNFLLNVKDTVVTVERIPDYPIEKVFVKRWSPRAFDASPMPSSDLLTMLEAARWAPSAFNVQPWRFLYSLRDDDHWPTYLNLLDPFNSTWARNASALVFVLSDTVMPGQDGRQQKISRTHSFDAGAAWAQLALQATLLGYQAHAMAGIYFEQSHKVLAIPDRYRVEIAVAIGKRACKSVLPMDLRDREIPSMRLPVMKIASAGQFSC